MFNVYKADYNKIREELKHYNWSELLNGSFESDHDFFYRDLIFNHGQAYSDVYTNTTREECLYDKGSYNNNNIYFSKKILFS